MSYPYSQMNRLEEPHNYMYTPFQGIAHLQSYQSSRMVVVQRRASAKYGGVEPDNMLMTYALQALEKLFDAASLEGGKKYRSMLEGRRVGIFRQGKLVGGSLNVLAKGLEKLTTEEQVRTLDLLHALIAEQLTDAQDANTKVWLDSLIRRFEVTKKIYEIYPPGFGKGEGENTSVRLYWLFALALCLFYSESNEIKYLSTLLKVCDLLCSLPANIVQQHIPEHGLSVVLATEIVSVQLLAEKKGISFASE